VASARERRIEPGVENLNRLIVRHETRGQHQHVGIVVFAGQLRDLRRPRHRRPDIRMAIGRVAHTESRAAHQHAALHRPAFHLLGQGMRIVGVIGGLGVVRSDVLHVKTLLDQQALELLLQLEARVVGSNQNFLTHEWRKPGALPRRRGGAKFRREKSSHWSLALLRVAASLR
jgi:hypothetical protein